jgi:hypothetical protein
MPHERHAATNNLRFDALSDPVASGRSYSAGRICRLASRLSRSRSATSGLADGSNSWLARHAALIDQLRADGVVLTYDPHDRTLRADGDDPLSVTIGKDH